MLGIDADVGHLRFWVASGAAALLVLVCALALDWTRKRIIARFAVVGIGAAFGAILAWAFLAGASVRDQSAERRNLELRATQLTAQVLAPGSPLACLEGMAGESVETACEKTLFATPATIAAATSYIAARLNLLADMAAYTRSGGNLDSLLLPLRRSLEEDRFGFVAHVLALRDGCSGNRCPALALLRNPERVRANLNGQTLDRYVEHYLAAWAQPGEVPVVEGAAPPTSAVAVNQPAASNQRKIILDADFPSAASIPAVSIMNPEPKASPSAASVAVESNGHGAGPARKAPRKPLLNAPAQASASPGATLASPVDPVWTPGATLVAPAQASAPQPSPPPSSAAAGAPAQ
jgi:hypothetical protein